MNGTLISIKTLQIERTALREALKKYGGHARQCVKITSTETCECGWLELQKVL
ncbi:hypothetical protein LCGC14_2831170 [marine sediment metagenome]|uniref:Uncharacterized protein n=1 Tax=marine sediment metagenome TaxID=412755 RepID=A0A0F9B4Y6_9ZZZZ